MLPAGRKVERIERIRDGGSLAVTFESDGGSRYILFVPIQHDGVARYAEPVLIDCDPAKRPPDTDRIRDSELSGPYISISWRQAHDLLNEVTQALVGPLDRFQAQWLEDMIDAVFHDGFPL
jgi:hypothetical protein